MVESAGDEPSGRGGTGLDTETVPVEAAVVKRALRRLASGETVATGTPRRRGDDPDPGPVVAAATAAVADRERAVAFRERHGLDALRRAVETALSRGDRDLARDGQRALAAFAWCRRAATGERSAAGTRGRSEPEGRRRTDRRDHFRAGRGTPIVDHGEGPPG